jgi:hypothetical protein
MSSRAFGLLCPVDPAHGKLYGLREATAKGEGWYCSHQAHDGSKDVPASRPFFTTAQAEAATEAARKVR